MKIYAISDLHLSTNCNKPMNIFGPVWDNYLEDIESSWKKRVTRNDIVLIPGDISWAMKLEDATADLKYISGLKGTKVFIRGNHDFWWKSISEVRSVLDDKMLALQNDAVRIGNVVICGSRGWSAPENGVFKSEQDEKIYRRELIRLELSLKSMSVLREEGDKVICMMHYPPLDYRMNDTDVSRLLEKYKVDACVYGHLHNYDNIQKLKFKKNGIKYYLTSCDLVGNVMTEIRV